MGQTQPGGIGLYTYEFIQGTYAGTDRHGPKLHELEI